MIGLFLLWTGAAAMAAETRALVIAGLGGEPGYEEAFAHQAQRSAEHLQALGAEVVLLRGPDAHRERVRDELTALAARSEPGDRAVVLLIGHGSYDEREYRFNLPGPDPTGQELAEWLDLLPSSRQLVVAATSASGVLQSLLAAPRRTVITATRSGGERNVTVFGEYFVAALGEASADTDKDGYVSSLEAFRFAEAAVAEHYRARNQMATEHPLVSADAAALPLARLAGEQGFPPVTPGGDSRLAELEAEIDALKADKDNHDPDVYYGRLQTLLLEMATLRRRLEPEGS